MMIISFMSATRIGNWMFQYAFAKSCVPDAEVCFYVSPSVDSRYEDALRTRFDLLRDASIIHKLPEDVIIVDERLLRVNMDFRFDVNKNYLLRGYFQDLRWIKQDVAWSIYSMPCGLLEKIQSAHPELFTGAVLTSIQVRRGDYLKLPHRHPFVGKRFLRDAIQLLSTNEMEFVVCSDDISWCKSFFCSEFPQNKFHFIEDEEVLFDLFIPTICANNICSNSSFCWWGAYLNRNKSKRVVFPSMWYGIAMKGFQPTKTLYFKEVEVIKNSYSAWLFVRANIYMMKYYVGQILRRLNVLH